MASTVSTIQPLAKLPRVSESLPITTIPEFKYPRESSKSSRNFERTPEILKEINKKQKYKEEMSPAIAMTDSELACFHAVKFILRSHKELTDNDIIYAANYISSFYAHSSDMFQANPNATNILTDEQLIIFLVYADQRGICKFALTFNSELDIAIKTKDTVSLKKILLGPKEMFVELYDNPFLSTDDREFIIRLIAREMFTINLVLEFLKKKILNLETIDDTCTSIDLQSKINREDGVIHMAFLVTKCYEEVCFQDAKILEDDLVRASMSKYEKTPGSIYTVDKPIDSNTPQVYCFDTIDLIVAVTEDIPINPKTNQPFSEYALKLINQRFHKEIAMYRRYKQIKYSSTQSNE